MQPYELELRRVRFVWTYRDHSLEKYSHFPVKLSKSGLDKSKCIVCMHAVYSTVFQLTKSVTHRL
jgi:hypothetical protein